LLLWTKNNMNQFLLCSVFLPYFSLPFIFSYLFSYEPLSPVLHST
jgi:hypothetical protein